MKRLKPINNASRDTILVDYRKVLTAKKPHKALTKGKSKTGGRNNAGRITTRHHGGGHKRRSRAVDFMFNKFDIPAKVETIEYDPNRTGFISLVVYTDGERRYIPAIKSLKVGDKFTVSVKGRPKAGNRMELRNIPVGTFVCLVELKAKGGAKLARSAGTSLQVSAHDGGQTLLKMPSGEIRKVSDHCMATVGEISNSDHKLVKLGKAGRNRWLGVRPTVRGSAMNPVDHPHGGGEGRQGIGLRRGPKTRQGKLAYGVKTRRIKKYSRNLIVNRRKTKR